MTTIFSSIIVGLRFNISDFAFSVSDIIESELLKKDFSFS
jgi:hypothetical protein